MQSAMEHFTIRRMVEACDVVCMSVTSYGDRGWTPIAGTLKGRASRRAESRGAPEAEPSEEVGWSGSDRGEPPLSRPGRRRCARGVHRALDRARKNRPLEGVAPAYASSAMR